MSNYVFDLKIAVMFFPVVALLFSIPFILIEYHKYGSVSFLKSILTYSFILYLICAYFLIILPLPEKSEVLKLTTPRLQLIPFNFVIDATKHFTASFSFLKSSYVYVPLFNIALTIPFGIYLRYFFHLDLKKTVLYTFLLSLFFELTQLSGLYFIYPRGYRLCDIDDLILNTSGGLLGYYIAHFITKPLPTIDKINKDAREKGKELTGFKRSTSLFLDLFLYLILTSIVSFFWNMKYMPVVTLAVYYLVIPFITKGSTLGQKYLNLKIVNNRGVFNIFYILLRVLLFISIYFIIPFLFEGLLTLNYNTNLEIVIFIGLGLIFIFYTITAIKYLFTSKTVIYEKLSKTKLVSTIK